MKPCSTKPQTLPRAATAGFSAAAPGAAGVGAPGSPSPKTLASAFDAAAVGALGSPSPKTLAAAFDAADATAMGTLGSPSPTPAPVLPPPPARQRRFAIGVGARFCEIRAGILKRDSQLAQKTRLHYYFGTGDTAATLQNQQVQRVFSGVRVPGDPAQDAIFAAAAPRGGVTLPFLSWHADTAPPQPGGNGFAGTARLAVTSDGTGTGAAEGICFTLTECGPRRRGTVRVGANGLARFAPLGGPLGGGAGYGGAGYE